MASSHPVAISSTKRTCGHCRTLGAQEILHTVNRCTHGYEDDKRVREHFEWHYLTECEWCEELSLWKHTAPRVEDLNGTPMYQDLIVQVHPPLYYLDEIIPNNIRAKHAEAWAVRDRSPDAFVTLVGKALDMICLDQGAEGRDLYPRLQDLANKGSIPPSIADASHIVRILRNTGAHVTDKPLGDEHLEAADNLVRLVTDYVYVLPSRIDSIRSKI